MHLVCNRDTTARSINDATSTQYHSYYIYIQATKALQIVLCSVDAKLKSMPDSQMCVLQKTKGSDRVYLHTNYTICRIRASCCSCYKSLASLQLCYSVTDISALLLLQYLLLLLLLLLVLLLLLLQLLLLLILITTPESCIRKRSAACSAYVVCIT
jgi:hypothetical protein